MQPHEFDIYANTQTGEVYIFHAPIITDRFSHVEYDFDRHRLTFVKQDGARLDVGVGIEWLVRPYIERMSTLYVVRTENGVAIDGVELRVQHVGREPFQYSPIDPSVGPAVAQTYQATQP